MPLNGIGSYLTTMDEISAHWAAVLLAPGHTPPNDLKLQGGFTRAMFVTLRTDLSTAITGLEDLENARELLVATRDQKKTALMQRINQFRGMLRGLLPDSIYLDAAPLVPSFGLSETKFLAPFDDMASLWGRIDADTTIAGFTPPLLLAGYTRATFVTDLADLRSTYSALTQAENDQDLSRKKRDAMLPIARERMIQYRELVIAIFGPDSPFTQSLPSLTSAPGSTPEPVVLTGSWNAPLHQAVLNWTPSTNPDLQDYEVRNSAGSTYDEANSVIVATLPPLSITLQTAAGLLSPAMTATFKVIVKLHSGNHASSNPVSITNLTTPPPL